MKPSELEQFERSYCSCDKCKAGCKSMPGCLAPGDMDRITDFLGIEEPTPEWIAEHFAASEGALVITADGHATRIPTITPKQRENGRCVFLTSDDQCSIHQVSPFGCRCFKVCDDNDEAAAEVSRAGLSAIAADLDYNMLHDWMTQNGITAMPLSLRKMIFTKLLDELDNRHEENPQET